MLSCNFKQESALLQILLFLPTICIYCVSSSYGLTCLLATLFLLLSVKVFPEIKECGIVFHYTIFGISLWKKKLNIEHILSFNLAYSVWRGAISGPYIYLESIASNSHFPNNIKLKLAKDYKSGVEETLSLSKKFRLPYAICSEINN
jgi:hypothetical protein